jgi:hypothetical protein
MTRGLTIGTFSDNIITRSDNRKALPIECRIKY